MIQAITFDLDDTLWSTADVISRAEQTMFDWLDEYCPAFTAQHTPETFLKARKALMVQAPDIAHNLKAVRKLALTQCLQELGVADASRTAAMASDAFQTARQQVVLFEGVESALKRLAQQVPVAAITNGTTQISNTPVADAFSFCLNAEDFDKGKPAPDMFVAALDKLGLDAPNVLHVGDHWEQDILAAHALGFQTAWINGRPAHWDPEKRIDAPPPGPEAKHVVRCVSDLPDLLGF